MKIIEALGILFMIGFFGLYIFYMVFGATDQCKRLYGNDWKATGYYKDFCVNSLGEVKGQ